MVVAQVARGVEAVPEPSNTYRGLESDAVGEGASEKAEDAEGRVERSVGVVGSRSIKLTGSAQSIEGVEHARAHEASERDEEQLEGWGCIAWDVKRAKVVFLVHPSLRSGWHSSTLLGALGVVVGG